ncbi:class I SAM-dependent methyltransferase [Marinobacter sp. F3R08]|uniref:class I SAM-dependent methyltransferase n=1 Tax=Marinobacter sp. F3R08 TaxID=2841559 RepID=UPI001C093ECF|nr:methyltransferase domain-containing protein [Marinobacter sp. F3R08]MBU2952699.1 methyltransferase domain-containing protein [Marinobacter sp. F3R08]
MKRSNATTERLFRFAGVSEGMAVLELGSGPGEVSELLSEIVGSAGSVLAIDHSKELIASAQKKLEESGKNNVRFLQADLNDAPTYLKNIDLASFDAVVGRRVLMYLPSPDSVLSSLLPWLRKDGLVVFEEYDSTMCPGVVSAMPAHQRAASLLDKMLAKEGVDQSMGFHLPATYSKAGLKFEAIWAEAVIDGQGDQYSLGELLELVKPRLESSNIAAISEVDELIALIEVEKEPTAVFVSAMRFCAKAINE